MKNKSSFTVTWYSIKWTKVTPKLGDIFEVPQKREMLDTTPLGCNQSTSRRFCQQRGAWFRSWDF